MKKLSVSFPILLLLLFAISKKVHSELPINDIGLEIPSITDAQVYDGNYYFLQYRSTYGPVSIYAFKDNEFFELPNSYQEDGEEMEIYTYSHSNIEITKSGKLILSGRRLYLFDNNNWEGLYLKDEQADYRTYLDCCIDSAGTVWTFTMVLNNDDNYAASEILKFNGTEFEEVLTLTHTWSHFTCKGDYIGKRITTLSNGKVVVNGAFEWDEDQLLSNIYIFDQKGNIEKYMTPCFDKEPGNWQRWINDISEDPDGNLWVSLARVIYNEDPLDPYNSKLLTCCGGLAVLKNKEWVIYNPDLGFDLANDSLLPSGQTLIQTEQGLFYFAEKRMYRVLTDGSLDYIPTDIILENAHLIPAHPAWSDSQKANGYIEELFDETNPVKYPGVLQILRVGDNIWLVTAKIIFVIEQIPAGINEIADSSSLLYPNPTVGKLNFENHINAYKIYDSTGRLIKANADYSGKEIDVSSLCAGHYIIRYSYFGDNRKYSKSSIFIKQ